MAGGVPAARLSIEIVAEIARLQADLDKAKRMVTGASADIAKSAKAANDNLASIGKGAGAGVQSFSRDIAALKAQLDPAWAAQKKYNEQVKLGTDAFKAGALDRQQFITHMRQINSELKSLPPVQEQVIRGNSQQRAGFQQLGYQLGDFSTQISSGTSVTQAFAQQIGQTAQALQLMGGGAGGALGKLAAFLMSGWGIAFTVALPILGTFISKLFEAEDATKKVKDANETLAEKLSLTKHSFDEVAEATRDYNKEQDNARALTLDTAAAVAREAAANINAALALRQKLSAQLEANKAAEAGNFVIPGSDPVANAMAQSQLASNQTKIEAALAKNAQAIQTLTSGAWTAVRGVGGELAKIATDPRYAIEERFKRARAELDNMHLGARAYADQAAAITRQEQAALKTLEDRTKETGRLTEATRQYGREVTLAQSLSIARGAGFRVTDALRTVKDQQWLYDNRRTPENPVAKPNANAPHVRGKAIDIAFGAGVTVEAIQKAYADAGVRLTKILRETGHFHIEWSTTGADKAQREVDKLADAAKKAADDAAEKWRDLQAEITLTMMKAGTALGESIQKQNDADFAKWAEQGPGAAVGPTDAQVRALNDYSESMGHLKDLASGLDLSSAFGRGGDAINGMIDAVDRLTAAQENYNIALEAAKDEGERTKAEKAYTQAKLAGTSQILSSSKKLFNEQSGIYKAITTAEKVLAAIQLVNTIRSMAMETTHTAVVVAASGARTAAKTAEGAATMFSFLGPFAFPVIAAMLALMATLGFKGGKGASAPSIPSAEDLQKAAGTGSVLGDSNAKSNSIANSLEIMADNTNKDLEYTNEMVVSLRAIESGIGKLAGTVAKQIQVAGGMFDTSGANIGSSGSSGFLGLFGSSTTRELWDVGIKLNAASISDIVAGGISGSTYQVIQQIKKSSGFLGIGGGTKTTYQTTTGQIDDSITSAIGDVISSLRTSLVGAAGILGIDGAQAMIDAFQVNIGTLSFKDMTGQEIEDQLNAVFSKVGDDLAGAILPSLVSTQLVGEGLYETMMRVVREYQVVDVALKSIGLQFGSVGVASIEARDRLVQLFGSLDEFVTQTNYYRDNFLTTAEQIAPLQASISSELSRLGLSSVDSIDKFKGVVSSLDLTTTAGQDTYAALMALAPAFYQVEQSQAKQAQAAIDLAKTRSDMELTLLKAQGNAAGALAKQRQAELAAMDASLRPLQEQIYKAQDIATAKDALSAAYKRESADLQTTIDKFQNLSDSLKAFRETLYAGTGGVDSYRAAMIRLMQVGGSAAGGDADAMGQFSGVAGSFLDAAKNNASTAQQYQRDVAMVARYTDQAIGGANSQGSIAQRQLDAMKTQVGALIDINDSVLSVHDAVVALNALGVGGYTGSSASQATADEREERRAEREETRAEQRRQSELLERNVVATQRMARRLDQWDRAGSLAVATDSDTPLATVAS